MKNNNQIETQKTQINNNLFIKKQTNNISKSIDKKGINLNIKQTN